MKIADYKKYITIKKASINDKEIIEEINEYHDLYYDTRKDLIINNLPKDLRNAKVVKSIIESIDELKNGNYVFFEDFKKELRLEKNIIKI